MRKEFPWSLLTCARDAQLLLGTFYYLTTIHYQGLLRFSKSWDLKKKKLNEEVSHLHFYKITDLSGQRVEV